MRSAPFCIEGRSDLYTVTGAETIDARPGLRESADALDGAARACDAVTRLFETGDPHPGGVHAAGQRADAVGGGARGGDPGRAGGHAGPANALAFRLKLLLAAGIVPQLGSCATCGEREHLTSFSAAAGGVVCNSCQSAGFTLDQETYEFMVDALGRPLARAPQASARALIQAERAIRETAEHHAHVHLRPATLSESRGERF